MHDGQRVKTNKDQILPYVTTNKLIITQIINHDSESESYFRITSSNQS